MKYKNSKFLSKKGGVCWIYVAISHIYSGLRGSWLVEALSPSVNSIDFDMQRLTFALEENVSYRC